MSENIRKRKDPDRKAFVRRTVCVCVSAVCVLLVAVVAYFVPFRTLLPAYQIPPRGEGELRLHFLSVGQGDCTVVEFPRGDCLVVDGGDGSYEHNNKLCRYLKGLAPARISLLATHADIDHCGGFPALLRTFAVETLYLPAEDGGTPYASMCKAAEERGVGTQKLTRYAVVSDGSEAYAVCISPRSIEEAEIEENDASVVLYLRYGETSALLSADISKTREDLLLREYALDDTIFDAGEYAVRLEEVDVLKVAHHGSSGSSSEAWLSLLSPELAVVSCGRDNPYGHPASETIGRLSQYAEIYRTDERGDILITSDGTGYTVLTDYTR